MFSVRVPAAIRVPTPDGTYRCQSPAGQHLIMDSAAKLERGCTVAVLFGGKFVLVGRIVRRPVPSRHLVIECRDICGNKEITRVWGLKDKDVQIWRVTAVHTPAPFTFADASEEEGGAE